MVSGIIIGIISLLTATLIGLVSFWLKTVHREIKALLKELTDYVNELKRLVSSIQTQIEKGIEADIDEMKNDVRTLYERTGKIQSQISALKEKFAP